MNVFDRVDDMWLDALSLLTSLDEPYQSRAGWCVETLGYQGTLVSPDYNFVLNPRRKLDPVYAAAEFIWYLSGERDITRIVAYAKRYGDFAEGSTAWGAYGWRWHNDPAFVAENQDGPEDQLLAVIRLLREKPETRQAVMTMWNAGDLPHAIEGGHKDMPCTLSLQFLLREDKVHLVTTMRSQDVWLGFPYDVFCFTCLQRLVAAACGKAIGTYVHQIGTLHLYQDNFRAAVEAMSPRHATNARVRGRFKGHAASNSRSTPYEHGGWTIPVVPVDVAAGINSAVQFETAFRENGSQVEDVIEFIDEAFARRNMLRDLVLLCASKWTPLHAELLSSPLMKEALLAAR